MGGYGPMIAQAGIQAGQNDLARKQAIQDEERRTKLGIATQAWNQTTDPNQRQQIQAGIDSLYPTPAHGPALLADLLHLHGKERAAQAQPARSVTDQPISTVPPISSRTPQLNELGDNMNAPPPLTSSQTNELGGNIGISPFAASQQPQDISNVRQIAAAPSAADAWRAIAQIPSTTQTQDRRTQQAATNAQALAELNNKARMAEAVTRVQGNAGMLKLNKEAQALGYDDFSSAPPEATDRILQAVSAATRAPSQAALATYIRTKFGANPTADQIAEGTREHQQMMSGLTIGSHQQVVFDDAGIPHVITLASSSGKNFAPTSDKTPSGPPEALAAPPPGARAPGTKPSGGAVKSSRTPNGPSGSTNPLGFTKGNPIVKSDSAQYTKLAEEANEKDEALQSAKAASQTPSPSSDQQLIYSWVRSNVQGAGRMTQAEFNQASHTGSLPQKAQNWYSIASTGKLTPEIRSMLLGDIQRSADVSKQGAESARAQLQQDSGGKPQSSKTPNGPATWTAPKDAPPAPKIDGKFLKANGKVIAKSQGGNWVQP